MIAKDKSSRKNIKDNTPERKAFSTYEKKKPRTPRKITEKYLYNSGLYYLQRYSASTAHFKSVMIRKIRKSCKHHTDQDINECAEMLDSVIIQFTEHGHLDDAGYIKAMTSSLRRRGLSKRAIQARLNAKGVPPDETATALGQYDAETYKDHNNAEKIAAIVFCRKKKLGSFALNDKKTFEQFMGSLARAGFNFDTARSVLDMSEEECEEFIAEN